MITVENASNIQYMNDYKIRIFKNMSWIIRLIFYFCKLLLCWTTDILTQNILCSISLLLILMCLELCFLFHLYPIQTLRYLNKLNNNYIQILDCYVGFREAFFPISHHNLFWNYC